MPLSFRSFEWGRLLEHSFLEHFCLDQFCVFLGKCYMQESRTPRLLEHFWVPILGASCSNKLFVLSVKSPALILSKNSGVFLAKIGSKLAKIGSKSAQNRLKSAHDWLKSAQNWLKSALPTKAVVEFQHTCTHIKHKKSLAEKWTMPPPSQRCFFGARKVLQ